MLENYEAKLIYRFFRWFQLHGEKYVHKSIEEMIKIYLSEKNENK
jgi:hypothetical protein